MSVASVSDEQNLQNGTSNGARLGGGSGSPTSSNNNNNNAQVSSPSKGGIDLPFGPGNEILNQPSSPPHNYRHSRAYRHFKNPPQPHMCIRVTTLAGEEVFINVLSWTRIVVPQEPTDPIPLYGGMKVPPGSPRCPPLVYAVMANPEVLKDSGRHSKDPEERRAMVELMCDFVEAMNPDLRLNRNAVILKDRDISGELKDVWNAVQAQRDREREEQMIQQHNHVPPPQKLFPSQNLDVLQQQQQQLSGVQNSSQNNFNASDNKIMYMELGPETASVQGNASSRASINSSEQQNSADKSFPSSTMMMVQSAIISNNSNNVKNSLNEVKDKNDVNSTTTDCKNGSDLTDSPKLVKNGPKDSQMINSSNSMNSRNTKTRNNTSPVNESQGLATSLTNSGGSSSTDTSQNATSPVSPIATSSSSLSAAATVAATTASTSSTSTTTTTAPTTKKEKLGGFLPNSCIFPRFKNKNKDKNKEKDKDKDKDKEKSSSNQNSKEKTLLNSLKKTTTAATNAFTKSHNHNEDSTTATAMKNCLNLEAEVEKLDLNKMDAPHANEVLIKVATPAAK